MSVTADPFHPPWLSPRFELKKNTPVTLTLQNPSGDRVAFKVKTTSPKKYCVRPSNGFVEPNSSKDVQVILQAQREMPASLAGGAWVSMCVGITSGPCRTSNSPWARGPDISIPLWVQTARTSS